jgi:biotin carboxylase
MSKRVLFLGGAYAQIPVIAEAKRRGYYVITCDYLPQNPGHKLANEYHNLSTTDYNGVLRLAKRTRPDCIVAYASDPAAPVASFVSEKLGLPGNPYDSVRLLSEKDLFRKLLRENGFNTPNSVSISKTDEVLSLVHGLTLPIIVKPTDSSGSKGVTKVDDLKNLAQAVTFAFTFSRNGRIIAEEFIDNDNGDLHGDGFVIDGRLVFTLLGDHIYHARANPFNPTGTTWPTIKSNEIVSIIEEKVERIIQKAGFKNGPINIEARINNTDIPYIIEIGPRNGGHFVPQAIQYASGFNMVAALLDILVGKEPHVEKRKPIPTAYVALHSDQSGILQEIEVKPTIQPFIKEFHQYVHPGDEVKSFQGANAAIGILLLSFSNNIEMNTIISGIQELVKVKINSKS